MMSNKTFLPFLFFLIPFLSQSQDSSRISTLEEVTVTASRTEQQVLKTPRSVTVITANDIQKLPYQNIADLLQRYEGIFIPGTFQNPGSLQTLYLRGADNKQTLVMIDGVRVSDVSSPDNGLDLNELSLNSIERIEIVRGSQGTLYGGSAVGGVINILTRKNSEPGTTGLVKINAGTLGEKTFVSTSQAGVTITGKTGFYGRSEITYTNSNGFNNSLVPPTGFFINEKDNFHKTDYSAKAGYNKNGLNGYIGYRLTEQKADIDDGPFQDDENNVLKYQRNLLTYGVSKPFNKNWSAKFTGGFSTTKRDNYDDSSLTSLSPRTYDATTLHSVYTGSNFSNELQVNYQKDQLTIVGGTGFELDKMNTHSDLNLYAYNLLINTNYDTVGLKMNTAFLYAHANYEIPFALEGKGLTLSGGVRYSNNNKFGSFFSYEFTPSVQISKNVSVFAGYSTGYNAPSLYQLFAPEFDYSSGITRGFSGLRPEESGSVELGMKAIINKKIGVRWTVYHNEVKNYIDYVYLWNGSKAIGSLTYSDYRGDTYLNSGKQTNEGVEVGADITFSPKWQLLSNVTFNSGRLEYDPSFIDAGKTKGNYVQLYSTGAFLTSVTSTSDLIRRPQGKFTVEHGNVYIKPSTFNVSLLFKPRAKWQLTADARSVGDRSDVVYDPTLGPYGALSRVNTKSFALFNLSALWKPNNHFTFSGSVFNIFDKKYQELNGFQTRGRSEWISAQYNF